MHSPIKLLSIAQQGFADMLPALRQAFNNRRDDDRLPLLFGHYPRSTVLGLTILGVLLGPLASMVSPNHWVHDHVNWSAVIISITFALYFRRYLFRSGKAEADDFTWLAASLIPAATLLVMISVVGQVSSGDVELVQGGPFWTGIGAVLVVSAKAIAVATALTVSVAALCFTRNWPKALLDLALMLFVLEMIMAFMLFMMLEIGITDRILSAILEGVFGIRFADWVGDFADQLSYSGFVLAIYLGIIGATWTACRESFGELLKTGHVDVLKTIKRMIDPPKPKKEKKPKEPKKRAREDG
ncbi:MAG: hypothetical protein AAF270_09840 [Pseudomonadota bacterium]